MQAEALNEFEQQRTNGKRVKVPPKLVSHCKWLAVQWRMKLEEDVVSLHSSGEEPLLAPKPPPPRFVDAQEEVVERTDILPPPPVVQAPTPVDFEETLETVATELSKVKKETTAGEGELERALEWDDVLQPVPMVKGTDVSDSIPPPRMWEEEEEVGGSDGDELM